MKRPLLLLVLSGLGMYYLKAQSIEAAYENNFEANISYVFENLNFSEVTTNLLLDRSIPFIEVDSFDGVQLLEYNKLDVNRFGLLYATMFGAALDTSVLLPHPDAYMAVRDSLQFGDAIPIAVFHYDYHRFKAYSLDSNLLMVQDSQLFDVPNRPESPYLLKKALAVTPLLTVVDTLDITFSLPDSLVFTNSTGIAMFEVDLDNGDGYQTLGFNQSITANYEEEGEKELQFKITLTDSTVHVGHAIFYAMGIGINSNFKNDLNKDYENGRETGFSLVIEETSEHEEAVLQAAFGCPDLGLRKPLLYIQGYIPKIGNSPPQNFDFLLSEERFNQPVPGGSGQILDLLEEEGYDLIFLQLSNSGDYVARNAQIVKKAIRKLNELKRENGSEEELIVIGASAGGLYGKYALLEMEQAGEDHEVKTFISLDAPFRGANLPVGGQFMVLHLLNTELGFLAGTVNLGLASFVGSLQDLQAVTHDGFLQNLVFYNIFEEPSFFGTLPNNLSGGDMTIPVHADFLAELEAMGELQNCEFVAFSNGSAIQQGQGFNPGDKLLEVTGGTSELLEEVDGIGSFLSEVLATTAWIFATGVRFDLAVYALPDNPSTYKKVYEGSTKIFIGGWIPVNWTNFTGKVKGTVPYDNAPGGTAPISRDSVPGFVNVFHENICLVPTVSAIDITSPENEDLFQDLSDVAGVTGSGLSLTDRYDASTDANIGGAHNQAHASLNSTNIPFLMAELASGDSLKTLPAHANGSLFLGNRTYNYGDAAGHFDPAKPTIRHTSHQLKDSLWVENTGKLWVNRNDKISFTDVTDHPANTTGSHFDLFIQGQSGCELTDAELHIENGGNMTIGAIAVQNTADVYEMDGAKVFVQNAGELVLEWSSDVIVESGGEVTLASGGLYQSHGDSETRVRNGGVFRVGDGGVLRMVDEAKLLVEPGGQLILDDGAIVQLWDATQPDGLANIHIQGELVINGSFDFNGSGFFQFDAGHVLTLASGVDFEMDGNGQGKRFIRLNEYAVLDIGTHGINLSNGKVEFEVGSSIQIGNQGSGLMVNVDFVSLNQPTGADAILANSAPRFVTIVGCHFEGLVTGVGVDGATGIPVGGGYNRYLRVNGSTFHNCEYAVVASRTPFVEIVGSDFTTTSPLSFYALSLRDVGSAHVSNCNVSGYTNDLDGAVSLFDVPNYNMIGGTVSGNALGIKATGQSNIDMTSQATVSGNTTSIEMYGGDAFGVLTMDCARLLDNGIGVYGTDVTLNIDASGELKPNHFRTVAGNPLFQICYNSLAGVFSDPIDAKDNFWEGPKYYLIYDPALPGFVSCGHYYGNLNLLTTPEALSQACNNGPGDPQ